ncbi:MAG: ATP synthase subunit I [Neisseria sp.]|uniref:ATP synthase subunit I n=1 Tax=Neisseria sp. TaxID=192066 RepID=UPI0026DB0950|nr:ATP synthase subunit I [Neisseria sp.]MDO4641863.1 ATP synthase subunit I [Neisseria sp.]
MGKILLLQSAVLLLATILSGISGRPPVVWSVLAGGLCYFIPSSITVLILRLLNPYPQFAGYGFLVGEGLRIVLALLMMVSVFAIWHQTLVFIPFLLGLLAVSHVVFLIFWKVQRYGK